LRKALADCKSQFPLAVVEFAIETAARQSEIASLTWSDVDLVRQTARLRGVDGRVTKNGDTYRDIPLSRRAVSILSVLPRSLKGRVFPVTQNALKLSWQRSVDRARKSHVHAQLKIALKKSNLDDKSIAAEIRALTYHKKDPRPDTVSYLANIETSDKILVDLHFHDLRHEATSRLAEKLSMQELMKVTGHKSSAMIARYYHPRASDLALKLG
jgi:integrase